MQYNNKKATKAKATWTRTDVAEMYGICTKTLKNWLDAANYKLRPNRAITCKELKEIFALFGNPLIGIGVAEESEKLEESKDKK